MKTCSYCGGKNEETAKFCGGCGTPFQLNEPADLGNPKARLILATAILTSIGWGLLLIATTARKTGAATNSYWVPTAGVDYHLNPPTVSFAGTGDVTLHYREGVLKSDWHPFIDASINGVNGILIIDTGAGAPVLSMTAARRCGVPLSGVTNSVQLPLGYTVQATTATNVTAELSPGLAVTWPIVWVDLSERPWLGLLDYDTLKTLLAVVDMDKKTIDLFPRPNSQGGASRTQPFSSGTNRPSAAAASRRSP